MEIFSTPVFLRPSIGSQKCDHPPVHACIFEHPHRQKNEGYVKRKQIYLIFFTLSVDVNILQSSWNYLFPPSFTILICIWDTSEMREVVVVVSREISHFLYHHTFMPIAFFICILFSFFGLSNILCQSVWILILIFLTFILSFSN